MARCHQAHVRSSQPLGGSIRQAMERNTTTAVLLPSSIARMPELPIDEFRTDVGACEPGIFDSTGTAVELHLHISGPSLKDQLAKISLGAKRSVRYAMSAALVELASFGTNAESTSYINPESFVRALSRGRVSISPRLRMSRKQLVSSSFFVPSGAYLTWLEVLKEEENGRR